MFRNYRNPYSLKRRRKGFQFWKTLLWLLIGLVGIELLAQLLVFLAGERATLKAYNGQPAEVYAYQLQAQNAQGEIVPSSATGQLKVQPDWSRGYALAGEQSSSYWTINSQGFRYPEELPLEKPQDEVRIFLLGGAAAFGQGVTDDSETIAAKLESRLQERLEQQQRSPEKYRPAVLPNTAEQIQAIGKLPPPIKPGQYKVINAAVPGYASGNQLAQIALDILPYQPDAIILMNGYEDVMLTSEQEATVLTPVAQTLQHPVKSAWQAKTRPIAEFFKNTTTAKAIQLYLLKPERSLAEQSLPQATKGQSEWSDHLPADITELESRTQRYRNHIKQIIQLCAGANVPLIVSLQPEITGISEEKLQPEEAAIVEELPGAYREVIQEGYAQLSAGNDVLGKAFPNNVKALNYYDLFDNLSAVAFTDPVHLTEGGNQAIAERLYNAIAQIPQLQRPTVAPQR